MPREAVRLVQNRIRAGTCVRHAGSRSIDLTAASGLMISFDEFLMRHAALLREICLAGARERRFPIRLPSLVPGKGFQADLVLPAGFPAANARVHVSADAVLRIPHVDDDGKLSFLGDAGPSSGAPPKERIDDMLFQFADKFYNPWRAGLLDTHFELTAAATAHAVALIAEAALEQVDALVERPRIKSWVRGQRFLNAKYPGSFDRWVMFQYCRQSRVYSKAHLIRTDLFGSSEEIAKDGDQVLQRRVIFAN